MSKKRELQQQKKEEKLQAAARRQATLKLMSKVGLYGVAPVFVLIALFTLFTQGPTYSPVEIAETDHIRGVADNPVTLTMYADFQCPACAEEYLLITRAWPELRDRARLVFRHYPLTDMHPFAWTASLYAEAAGRQERFWEMHDLLFVNQAYWAGLTAEDVTFEFDSYATQLGLDMEQLKRDMEDPAVIEKIRSDQRSGTRSGVRATPTLFINGSLANASTVTRLVQLVNDAAGG
ncbi:MAG: hypothetical protein RLZZ385_691 [Pseudomonadota bacterium]|jgi:protein-disulfide isomerase